MQILQQPQDFLGRLGETASFTVVVEGSGITYSWQYSSNSGSTWKTSGLAGKTTATASGELTTERLNYMYRCVISDGAETVYSDPVVMILLTCVLGSTSITLSTVIDVAATYRYYLLQSSTLNPPAKPTVNPPGGNWSDTEPTYTNGSTNTLYFVDLTVFSDGTWSYSSVSRSSAYEAAKEAYNRATAAADIAYEAQSAVVELEDNMELQLENVHAQITETADSIRQEVQANYASSAGVDQLRQQVTSLSEQTEDNFTWSVTRINQLQSDLTDGQEATDEQLALIRTYMSFTEAGLIIGKTGNPFTFRVVNNKLSFYMNETEVAYLSNNKLYVTQAEILTRLQIGKFAYEPQTNGNLSLIYTG